MWPGSCESRRGLTQTHAPQHAGTNQTAQAAIDKETEVKKKEIGEAYYQNKDQVVQKLLDRVVLVNPELHRNLQKQP